MRVAGLVRNETFEVGDMEGADVFRKGPDPLAVLEWGVGVLRIADDLLGLHVDVRSGFAGRQGKGVRGSPGVITPSLAAPILNVRRLPPVQGRDHERGWPPERGPKLKDNRCL